MFDATKTAQFSRVRILKTMNAARSAKRSDFLNPTEMPLLPPKISDYSLMKVTTRAETLIFYYIYVPFALWSRAALCDWETS